MKYKLLNTCKPIKAYHKFTVSNAEQYFPCSYSLRINKGTCCCWRINTTLKSTELADVQLCLKQSQDMDEGCDWVSGSLGNTVPMYYLIKRDGQTDRRNDNIKKPHLTDWLDWVQFHF